MPRGIKKYTYKEFVRVLVANGFSYNRSRGDHDIYTDANGRHISVPTRIACVIARRLIRENNLIEDIKTIKKKNVSMDSRLNEILNSLDNWGSMCEDYDRFGESWLKLQNSFTLKVQATPRDWSTNSISYAVDNKLLDTIINELFREKYLPLLVEEVDDYAKAYVKKKSDKIQDLSVELLKLSANYMKDE